MAILPGEVAVAAPNWQNGLPAPLARDRGAPGTQRGHPDSRVALVTRLDHGAFGLWFVIVSSASLSAVYGAVYHVFAAAASPVLRGLRTVRCWAARLGACAFFRRPLAAL